MNRFAFNKKGNIVIILLLFFCVITFWIRFLPEIVIVTEDWVNLLGNDPWYNIRLVEATVNSFPGFTWFDPLTHYPTGMNQPWGPLFTYCISFAAMIFGASSRPELMYIGSIIPALMAVVMIPLIYLIGLRIDRSETGLIAAGFLAIISGQYMYRSLFGFADHHIAEVLFSTLFASIYIIFLNYTKKNAVTIHNQETLKKPALISVIAGFAFLLGYLVMPTMILFAFIVAIYTVFQFIWDRYRSRSSDYLLLVNLIVFGIAAFGAFLLGSGSDSLSLWIYTYGQVFAFGFVILGTVLLYVIAELVKKKPNYIYPLVIVAIGIFSVILIYLISPQIYSVFIGGLFGFFGEAATTLTVQEARPWSFMAAWETFNFGLILMIGGFGVLLYKLVKEDHPHNLFVIIWSAIILFSTMRHIRYEYYLAVNIALLSGVFVGTIFLYGWKDLVSLYKKDVKEEPQKIVEQKSKKRKKGGEKKAKEAKNKPDYVKIGSFSLVLIFTLLFVYLSLSTNIAMATSVGRSGMNGDWRSSLEWLQDNTPDTGLDYYTIYEKETFSYPPESYGVMSWWDYGHWITFVAHRIPNANPFQAGVAGPNGSAAFFIQQSEADSSKILDNLGTRYVITDIEMDTGKFWAMATWYNGTLGVAPYQMQVLNQQGQPITVYKDAYFQTMISRLHNFDGSHTEPDPQFVFDFQGTRVSPLFIKPVEVVPALYHYRLVHESPTNVFNSPEIDLKYVKIFEFVPGARIKGQGVISVPVETDTGRTFIYRQESINGEFIVPYSTSGNPYDVRTTGKYTIEGTDLVFDVPEEAVIGGLSIN